MGRRVRIIALALASMVSLCAAAGALAAYSATFTLTGEATLSIPDGSDYVPEETPEPTPEATQPPVDVTPPPSEVGEYEDYDEWFYSWYPKRSLLGKIFEKASYKYWYGYWWENYGKHQQEISPETETLAEPEPLMEQEPFAEPYSLMEPEGFAEPETIIEPEAPEEEPEALEALTDG